MRPFICKIYHLMQELWSCVNIFYHDFLKKVTFELQRNEQKCFWGLWRYLILFREEGSCWQRGDGVQVAVSIFTEAEVSRGPVSGMGGLFLGWSGGVMDTGGRTDRGVSDGKFMSAFPGGQPEELRGESPDRICKQTEGKRNLKIRNSVIVDARKLTGSIRLWDGEGASQCLLSSYLSSYRSHKPTSHNLWSQVVITLCVPSVHTELFSTPSAWNHLQNKFKRPDCISWVNLKCWSKILRKCQ